MTLRVNMPIFRDPIDRVFWAAITGIALTTFGHVALIFVVLGG